jgi:hypothetical protein
VVSVARELRLPPWLQSFGGATDASLLVLLHTTVEGAPDASIAHDWSKLMSMISGYAPSNGDQDFQAPLGLAQSTDPSGMRGIYGQCYCQCATELTPILGFVPRDTLNIRGFLLSISCFGRNKLLNVLRLACNAPM